MQTEERTYYEENQKLEADWIIYFIIISSISAIAIAVGFLYSAKSDWTEIMIVIGAILFSDSLIIFLFKSMRLELALSKKGLHYRMFPGGGKIKLVSWSEVSAISIRKSPAKGYGKQQKFRYGEVYDMNLKQGVELVLSNGKKKFFSLKDPDEFKKSYKKLELSMQLV